MDKSRRTLPKHIKTALWTVFAHLKPDKQDELDKVHLQRLSAYVATAVNKFHQEQELRRYLPHKNALTFEEFVRYVQSYIVKPTDSANFDIIDEFCWRTVYRVKFLQAVQRWCRLGPTEEAAMKLCRIFHCLSIEHTISPAEAFCIVNRLNRTLHGSSTSPLLGDCGSRSQDKPDFAQRYTYWHLLNVIVDIFPARVDQGGVLKAIEGLENEVVHSLLKQGGLSKKGHARHSWKERWFVLTPGILKYYRDSKLTSLRGVVHVGRNSRVDRVEGKTNYPNRLALTCSESGKMFEISSESFEVIESWISVLRFAAAASDSRTLFEMSIIEQQKKLALRQSLSHLPNAQQLRNALEKYDQASRRFSVRRLEKNRWETQQQMKGCCGRTDGTVETPPSVSTAEGTYVNFPMRVCTSTESCSSDSSISSDTVSSCSEVQHTHLQDPFPDPVYSDLEQELEMVRNEIAQHEYLVLGRPSEVF